MRLFLALLVLAALTSSAQAQDRDGDRVPDTGDLCPDAREQGATIFPGDGCPDTDADRDGVVDDYDACPASSETQNGYHDLDGCRDTRPTDTAAVASTGPDLTRIGCLEGATLFDVTATESGQARLVPRADGPTWLGSATLDCYAGATHEGRRAIHCASTDGTTEVTLAIRSEGSHAIGFAAIRTAQGIYQRAWTGTALPTFDRGELARATEAQGDAIQACYEHELGAGPLAGRVVVSVRITTSGATEDVRVTSDTMSPARPSVGACVAAIVDALVIAAPPRCSPVTMTLPFVFELDPGVEHPQ